MLSLHKRDLLRDRHVDYEREMNETRKLLSLHLPDVICLLASQFLDSKDGAICSWSISTRDVAFRSLFADSQTCSQLDYAAVYDRTDMLVGDLNSPGLYDLTPLQLAIINDSRQVVRALINSACVQLSRLVLKFTYDDLKPELDLNLHTYEFALFLGRIECYKIISSRDSFDPNVGRGRLQDIVLAGQHHAIKAMGVITMFDLTHIKHIAGFGQVNALQLAVLLGDFDCMRALIDRFREFLCNDYTAKVFVMEVKKAVDTRDLDVVEVFCEFDWVKKLSCCSIGEYAKPVRKRKT